jgi:hypothetical protein
VRRPDSDSRAVNVPLAVAESGGEEGFIVDHSWTWMRQSDLI